MGITYKLHPSACAASFHVIFNYQNYFIKRSYTTLYFAYWKNLKDILRFYHNKRWSSKTCFKYTKKNYVEKRVFPPIETNSCEILLVFRSPWEFRVNVTRPHPDENRRGKVYYRYRCGECSVWLPWMRMIRSDRRPLQEIVYFLVRILRQSERMSGFDIYSIENERKSVRESYLYRVNRDAGWERARGWICIGCEPEG